MRAGWIGRRARRACSSPEAGPGRDRALETPARAILLVLLPGFLVAGALDGTATAGAAAAGAASVAGGPNAVAAIPEVPTAAATGIEPDGGDSGVAADSASGHGMALTGAWSRRTGRSVTVPLLASGGSLYSISTDGRIQSWSAADGERRWSRKLKALLETPPATASGPADPLVLVATRGRPPRLHALSDRDGKTRWARRLESAPVQVAVLDTIVLLLDQRGTLTARSVRDGRALWDRSVGAWRSPGFLLDGETVFAVARNDSAAALDPRTGEVRWRAAPGGFFTVPPVRCGAHLALVSEEGRVTWLHAELGSTIAQSRRASPQVAAGYAVGDRLLTISGGGLVEIGGAVPMPTDWRIDLDAAVVASPVVAGERVLAATVLGQLRTMRLSDGAPIGSYQSGAGFRVPPTLVEGRLVLADTKGNLHAYRF